MTRHAAHESKSEGYGEIVPLETDGARIFAAVLIFTGMGAVLYCVSAGTAFILEGQLGHVFRRRRMEKELAALDRHLLICGAGQTAIYTAQELVSVRRPTAGVDQTSIFLISTI